MPKTLSSRFLVVHDRGSHGKWAVVRARSAAEIETRFPELIVMPDRPVWMDAGELAALERDPLDVRRPAGLLQEILRDRSADGVKTG